MNHIANDPAAKALLSDARLGDVTMNGDTLQVVFERHYRASVERVWAAITTPERIAAWFAPAEIDLRAGGSLSLDANGRRMKMRITICDPPSPLVWVWNIGGHDTLVRFDLAPEASGCRLTLTHSGVPRIGAGVRAGWHAHLEALPDALEGRSTPWEMKVAREAALNSAYPKLPG